MDTPVIARESELAYLATFLDEVSRGPSGLLVEGEAGIGKTTLWRRGVAAAMDRSYRVLSCRPVQAEAKLSFAALGDLFAEIGPDVLSGLADPQRRALEIALLRAEPGGCPPDQRAVSVAAVAVLRRLADAGPLVVAVDDVQWLDGPSSRVLEFAIRRLHDVPVAMLVSFRTGGKAVPLGLDGALPEGNLYRLPVGPLNLGALQHLIRTRIGAALSRPVLLRIHAATGGNPFFALEMARMLQQKGAGYEPGQALPVPDDVRQLVRLRLAELPSRARRVLLAVAALARPTVALVEEITSAPERVTRDLERAARAGIIGLEAGRIVFTHPLLGSAIYADAPDRVRRSLHRRLAQLAAEPEERARHLALGADGPGSGVAQALEEAAHLARSRGAPDAAAELFELAARLTPAAAERNRWRRSVDAACCYWPGNYVALDAASAPPATPFTTFTITKAASPARLPAPQARMSSIEFGFRSPGTLHNGDLVRFGNDGFVVHMIVAARGASLAGAQKIAKLLKEGKNGQAQHLATGFTTFVNILTHGAFQQQVVNVRPGFWVLACFMDTQDGREHTRLGMERVIHITR